MNVFKTISPRLRVILVLFTLVFVLSQSRFFKSYEFPFYDILFRTRPAQDISDDIVLIVYSDQTLKTLGTWPVDRDHHATLVDVLTEVGVKAIVFDIVFSEPSLYDEVFIESIYKAKNVYFPLVYYIDSGQEENFKPLKSNELAADIREDFKDYLRGKGHINSLLGPNGKVRNIPLFIQGKQGLGPHISLLAACDSLGLDLKNVKFKKHKVIIDDVLSLPVVENASFFINYPGKWVESFRIIDYLQVMRAYASGRKGLKPNIDLSELKDKICFVGVTATAAHDYRANPIESVYHMLGVHASVYNSIISGKFIHDVPVIFKTLINLIVCLLSVFICIKNKPLQSLAISIVFSCLYFSFAWAIFAWLGFYVDVFLPLCLVGVTWASITLYNFLAQTRKKDLMEKELEIAQKIQKSFLPADIGKISGLDVFSFMQPAKFVAGDLYDIVRIDDDKTGIFIGDVSGKGVPASLIMAQTISLFRVFAKQSLDPAKVLSDLNKELAKVLEGRFVTAIYLILDSKNKIFSAASAGHNPIICYNSENDFVEDFLPSSGLPLGVMDIAEYESFSRKTHEGDKFILYTDGITEARDKKGNEFGEERLKNILLKDKACSGSQIMEGVKSELFGFSKGLPQFDDITLIVLAVVK